MPESVAKNTWTRVAFGEVVRLSRERSSDPEGDGFERYVGLDHIEPGELRIRRWGDTADGTTFTNIFRRDQVLFGKRRAYQRKIAVAEFDGVCSGDIYVLEPKNTKLLPELLPFICRTESFSEHAVRTSAGSISPRTNWEGLARFEFMLPPLKEQRRIAASLWAGERVKRSLLAVRDQQRNLWVSAFRSMAGLRTSTDEAAVIRGELDMTRSGWQIHPVHRICTRNRQGVQVGPFGGSVSSRYFVVDGVPVLKINNISEEGDLDLGELVQLERAQAAELSARYSVRSGDLVTAAQATIGRTALIDRRVEGALISQHLIRVSPDPQVCLPSWLHACFYSPLVLRQLHGAVQGGTRAGLNTDDVAGLLVPLPPISKQKHFAAQLETVRGLREAVDSKVTATESVMETVMSELIRRDV